MLDLGPESGDKGGEIVAEGTPEQVAREPRSYTGSYLKPLLSSPVGAEPKPGQPDAGEALPSSTKQAKTKRRIREAAE